MIYIRHVGEKTQHVGVKIQHVGMYENTNFSKQRKRGQPPLWMLRVQQFRNSMVRASFGFDGSVLGLFGSVFMLSKAQCSDLFSFGKERVPIGSFPKTNESHIVKLTKFLEFNESQPHLMSLGLGTRM